MLTAFGKLLRKIRIDNGDLLKDMADHLGISTSYLSAIEIGQRKIPKDLIQKISVKYKLSKPQIDALCSAQEDALPTISIDLKTASQEQRTVALAFARSFDDLDPESLKDIKKTIERQRRREGK